MMGILTGLYRSSIGKKFIAGLTGICLCIYLIVHLGGNLLLFKCDGGAAFNQYAELLPSLLIIRIIEWVLFAIFVLHIFTGTYLWVLNKRARPEKYLVTEPAASSSLFSRTMFLSGSIVFIFLVVHMRQFWAPSRFFPEENPSMYALVTAAFSSPVYSFFYVVAMVLLAFHLRHGFQSAFQTFGLRNHKYTPLIDWIGVVFWLLIPAGFAAMPVYLFFRSCPWFH
jgi:succinate dehydrogenase / fumarate reductase cytochrome b subunit